MKIKKSKFDYTIYILSCILTGGLFWLARVLITESIRAAIGEEEKK